MSLFSIPFSFFRYVSTCVPTYLFHLSCLVCLARDDCLSVCPPTCSSVCSPSCPATSPATLLHHARHHARRCTIPTAAVYVAAHSASTRPRPLAYVRRAIPIQKSTSRGSPRIARLQAPTLYTRYSPLYISSAVPVITRPTQKTLAVEEAVSSQIRPGAPTVISDLEHRAVSISEHRATLEHQATPEDYADFPCISRSFPAPSPDIARLEPSL